jgi:xyloglucan-specific exo-beta-1,4-glucanase
MNHHLRQTCETRLGVVSQARTGGWQTASSAQRRSVLAFLLVLGVCGSTGAKAQSFGNVTMGGGGYVTGIIACPSQQNLFYAKTDVGGAYRWDEGTQSWVALLDWNSQDETTYQGVESLAVDPQSPEKLYILAGTSYWNGGKTAILRSSDYGDTFAITDVTSKFKAHGNGSDRQKGETLAVDPNKGSILFCGTRANGLFKSTDSGVSWNAVSSLNVGSSSISFVAFDPPTGTPGNATLRIFVGVLRTGTNFFVSNDAGGTWTGLTGSPSNSLPQRGALASDRQLYITYRTDTNGAVMKYTTTNGAWANCSPSGNRSYCGISVCATNPQKLVATSYSVWLQQPWGWGDRIYVSTNAGASWNDIIANDKVSMNANGFPWIVNHAIHWAGALAMDPFNPDRVFVGSGNGIFSTTNLNSGATVSTWKFTVQGLEETVPLDFISVPGGPFITSVGDQGGFIHTDITVSPATGNISQSAGFAYAAKKPTFIARVVTDGELYYSQQLPVTWTKFPSTPDSMTNGKVAISANGSTVLWKSTVGSAHRCYLTTNLGANWTASAGLTFTCNPVADPENDAKFYAYYPTDGYLYASTNGGLNFYRAGQPGTGGAATFRVAPGLEGHIWIALGSAGVKYSTNSGVSFRSGNLSVCDAIAFGKAAPGATYPTLFIWGKPTSSGVAGMYRSNDQGATWLRVNYTAHQYGGRGNAGLIEGDKNVHGRVYMSTAGRGVAYMNSSVPVTGVTLSQTAVSNYVTATQQLNATVWPTNATYLSVTWASSNPAIASVSPAGWVTANAPGTTIVTVTTLDGGFVAGCAVTVTNLAPPVLTLASSGGSSITLSWPADHRGWFLQAQTNSLHAGLGTNWFTVEGSDATNQIVVLPDPANGSVFYRLVSP